jgi:CheY-like chemotaxis protein
MHRERILVIEDNTVDRNLLCEYLGGKYCLEFAADRTEALRCLAREGASYVLVLLDLRLPPAGGGEPVSEEGIRALHAILGRPNPPEVVVISGADERTLRRAEALATTFAKPITSKLAVYIDRQIAHRAAIVKAP